MKKKFVTNLGILLLLNLLIKPFWIFGIDMTVQNRVGSEAYGIYASLFSFTIIFNILLDLGITNFNNRNIARHSQLLKKYFSNMIVLKLLFAILYSIVCFSTAIFLHWDAKSFNMLLFLALNQFILSFILYLRSNLSGLHLFKTDSIISVTDRLVMIILCGYLLVTQGDNFKIEWFVYCQTAGYSISAIFTFILILKKVQSFQFKFDWKFLIIILKQTYPYATLVLFMALYMRTDIVMLEQMLPDGKNQAGIYAQPFRVIDAVSIFAYLFSVQLLPIFARMLKQKENVAQLVKLSYILLMIPVLTFTICSFFYSKELMSLFYHEHQEISSTIFKILVIGFIPISSSYIFGTLLTANKSLKMLNIISGIGMVMNIVLNLVLIPRFYALGAAIASLTTQLITSVAQIIASKHVFKMDVNFRILLKTIAFAALLIATNIITKRLFSSWQLGATLSVGVALLLAFALKLLYIKDVLQIVKSKKALA